MVENNTNIWRLSSLCAKRDDNQIEQAVFYTKGVGTTYGEEIRGGDVWFGITSVIVAAYEWLIATYIAVP